MAKDVSIKFSASDNLTNSIRQIQKSVSGLSRDVSEYRKVQSQAFDKRTEVKFDITKAKQELKELEKAVKQNAEGSEKAFKEKSKALEELQEEYKRLGLAAKEASKAELSLQKDIHQTKNYANTMGLGGKEPSIMSSLATAGLGNMIGGAISSNLGQSISSTFGSQIGNDVANVVGGIATGAAMGSIAGPGGAALGAAIGGLTGAIQSLTQRQEKKDDLFKDEVQGLYNKVRQEQQQGLESGIDYDSDREQNINGLSTLLQSKEKGSKMFNDIKEFGIDTPYEATTMLNSAKQMLAYDIKSDNIMSDMKMLGEVAMGDQNKFNSLSYAYAQTQSAGKLTGQDLMQYTAAGFNPLSVLAEQQGKSLSEMRELMSDGLITAQQVTEAFRIATSEGGKYYGAMAQQMETYAGKMSMLDDIKNEINSGYGEGYNKERKKGMEREIDQLNGIIGEKMQEANSLIGQYKADLENKYQQSIIDAVSNAQGSDEYLKAENENNGAEMGRILAEARAKAEIDYKSSEGYKLQLDADLALVQGIQEDTMLNESYLQYGKKMGEQFSKGYTGAVEDVIRSGSLSSEDETNLINEKGFITSKIHNKASNDYNIQQYGLRSRYATGLDRVPYNDMPALLHEGERVLTKVEADKVDKGVGGINIAKLADSIVIREEADIQKVVEGLYSELKKYQINIGSVR